PPMIAWLAKVAIILGKTTFTVRLLPALAGCMSIFLVVRLVKHLGGSFPSQVLAGIALLFSPALLGSNTLFQPVSFNQLGWLALTYLFVRLYQTQDAKYWYGIGIVAGLALLTKYSVAFWMVGLAASLLWPANRKWLATRHPYLAVGIALLMFLPNLFWQINHHWPLLAHMETLREEQLVNVKPINFLTSQLFSQGGFVWIWLAGLIGTWIVPTLRPYRWISLAYLITLGLLLFLSGKSYYLAGAYTSLFVLGALTWDHWLKQSKKSMVLGGTLALFTIPLLPLAIPILPLDSMVKYGQYVRDEIGLEGPFRWEDGEVRDLRQDYADMHGWEEMVQHVAEYYHTLPPEEQAKTHLYGGSYGHAGAINFYREQYDLPEAHSFSASFIMWIPEEFPYSNQIQIDDNWQTSSDFFENFVFVDSNHHEYARDPGYIYGKSVPLIDVNAAWGELVRAEKAEFGF
ncbi:MAG: glycosyltransferase family 39 protein, partial [Bacteroidota bacterium]